MGGRAVAVLIALGVIAAAIGWAASGRRAGSIGATATERSTPPGAIVPQPVPPSPDSGPGLRCIRGGTSREEVRRVMGEPDSIAFGDWLYGRSSVTFGYGVVLDYSNAGGNLVICP